MLYRKEIKSEILDSLNNRLSSIVGCIMTLSKAGFTPNKNKITKLNWTSILIHAYQNVDVLTEEQQNKLDNLYQKVTDL